MKTAPITLLLGLTIAGFTGCAPIEGQNAKQTLNEGYVALEQRQYDQAAAKADAFLDGTPSGPGSAEAMYLKGRAMEQSVTDAAARPTEQQARTALQAARVAYINTLKLNPSPQLEAYTRASLGNVAYFQDDYQTALTQWSAAFPKLDSPELKAWSLYRVGLCQQRLGQFDAADKTFASVQQQFAGTEPGRRAQQKAGARGFYVQLATFRNSSNADRAVASLRKQGIVPSRVTEQGMQQIRLGPAKTYAEAKQLKKRFAGEYPEAIIIP
jgi:outer membrane protein assembly factor BamD (BamD/ComL family)